ncbi:unnamed protein product [Rotaria magnacalcarata]|nr:unnamed protein product [Rotaria magnacalcarata]
MAELMLDLIDPQRIALNDFIQFIEALNKTIVNNEENEYDENLHRIMISYFIPCIQKLYSLVYADNEQRFYDLWSSFWNSVGFRLPDVAIDHIEDFLNDILDRKHIAAATLLPIVYDKRPQPYHARLNDIINEIFDRTMTYSFMFKNLFFVIVKEHPELITANELHSLVTSINMYTSTEQEVYFIFQGLGFVANAKPNLFKKYRTIPLNFVLKQHYSSGYDGKRQKGKISKGENVENKNIEIKINTNADE